MFSVSLELLISFKHTTLWSGSNTQSVYLSCTDLMEYAECYTHIVIYMEVIAVKGCGCVSHIIRNDKNHHHLNILLRSIAKAYNNQEDSGLPKCSEANV